MAELKGTVRNIGPLETVGQNNFQKQTVVIGYTKSWGGNNPGSKDIIVPVTFGGKATEKSSALTVGQEVTIQYDLEGREWQGKYFVDVKGYDVKVEGTPVTNTGSTYKAPEPAKAAPVADDSDSLPF